MIARPMEAFGPNRTLLVDEDGQPVLMSAISRPSSTAYGRIKVILGLEESETTIRGAAEFRLEMN